MPLHRICRVKKRGERRESMKYIVVKKETVKKDLMEKNFCFACGCFQGNTKATLK